MSNATALEIAKYLLTKFNCHPKEWGSEIYLDTRTVCQAFIAQDQELRDARAVIENLANSSHRGSIEAREFLTKHSEKSNGPI